MEELVYREALSCSAIEGNLLHLACTQSGLFLLAFLLSALTAALTAYILHRDRRVDYLLEVRRAVGCWSFYVSVISKVIAGWVLTCDSAHSW